MYNNVAVRHTKIVDNNQEGSAKRDNTNINSKVTFHMPILCNDIIACFCSRAQPANSNLLLAIELAF